MNLAFARHEAVRLDGVEYRVEQRTASGFLLLGIHDRYPKTVTTEDLLDAFDEGRLEIAGAKPTDIAGPDFAALPISARTEATKRRKVLDAANKRLGPPPYSDADLKKTLDDICTDAAYGKKVSVTTFRHWLKRAALSGNLRALAPGYDKRGRRKPSPDDPVEKQMRACIDEHILKPTPVKCTKAHGFVCTAIDEENETVSEDLHLTKPSRATFYRRYAAVDDEMRITAQEGSREADKKYKMVMPGPRELGPYDALELDHTPVDCLLTTKEGVVIGRPHLLAAVDRHTRMCAAIIITFEPPNAYTIMMLVRAVICGKDGVLANYPKIENAWPCRGLPMRVICDNGFEFHKLDLTAALQEIGIGVEYCETEDPPKKGKVERFFLTLNQGLIHELPGTTLSRFNKDKDHDPAMFARLTQEAFAGLLLRYICDVYHQRPHRTLRQAPVKVWSDTPAEHSVRLPPSRRELDIACFYRDVRTIQREGVPFEGFYYQSEDAHRMRKAAKARGKFEIRFNPLDLGSILVLDPETKRYVPIPCVSPEARGMSVWQRRALLKHLGENAGGSGVDRVRKAEREIHEEAHRQLAQGNPRKKVGRKRSAMRLLSQPAPEDSLLATVLPETPSPAPSPTPRRRTSGPRPGPSRTETTEDLDALAASTGMRVRIRRA